MIRKNFRNITSWFVAFVILLCANSFVFAQDFKKQYQAAKDLFTTARYSEAMTAFKALTVYDKNNPFTEYASFYYALSSYSLGYASVAKEQLLQIKTLYPQWSQMDEVNYLLSKIYFDQGEYFQALLIADQVQSAAFQTDLNNLKRVNLVKVEDLETLRMMWEEHPADSEVARALVKRMGQLPFGEQDTQLMNSLIDLFHFSREELIAENKVKPIFKEVYRVGLVMPFLSSTLDPSPVKKRNQFILELYQGMQFAADSLFHSGMKVELLAYDNERNLDVTRKLTKEQELSEVDLLVGPLFQEESRPMQELSKANHINLVVSPLSNNSEFASQNPNAFLFQPSHEKIGLHSAELANSYSTKKSCMVYYGESSKDSAMAYNFIARAKELNMKITHVERVSKESTGSILTRLSTATEYDEWKNPLQFSLKKDSIGCIFVASSNELIYSKVINSVENRKDSTLVIGQESWLNESTVDYSKYERIRVALAAPNFTSLTKSEVLDFRKRYINKYGVLPTEYAATGYEFIMVLGKIITKYGVNFLQTMPVGEYVEGVLMQGFELSALRDNERVPFVMLKNGQLKTVNYLDK